MVRQTIFSIFEKVASPIATLKQRCIYSYKTTAQHALLWNMN